MNRVTTVLVIGGILLVSRVKILCGGGLEEELYNDSPNPNRLAGPVPQKGRNLGDVERHGAARNGSANTANLWKK